MSTKNGTKKHTGGKRSTPRRTKDQSVSIKARSNGKGTPLWDKLTEPWSLVSCKRAIALAVEHNSVSSKLAEIKEQKKAIRDEWDEEHDATTAKKILAMEDETDSLKQRQKAITADLLRLSLNSVGADLFQPDEGDDEPKSRVRDVEGQTKLPVDARPVGRPDEPRLADGVDQHLAASVNELDMPERLKGRLVANGLAKIGNLVEFVDAAPATAAVRLEQRLECSEKQAASVVAALQAYRKEHRKAMRETEAVS